MQREYAQIVEQLLSLGGTMQFKPGDVLLYEVPGTGIYTIVPKLIRLCTGNKIVHVALYIGMDRGNHLILDAQAYGIRIMAFQDIINRPDGFKLSAVANLECIDKPAYDYLEVAYNYCEKPYGILTIFNLFLQHGKTRLFPKSKWSTWFKSKKGYICSEVCQLVVEEVLETKFPKPANLTEPDDYLSAPWKVTYLSGE